MGLNRFRDLKLVYVWVVYLIFWNKENVKKSTFNSLMQRLIPNKNFVSTSFKNQSTLKIQTFVFTYY